MWFVGLVLVIYSCAISCSRSRDLGHVSFFPMATLVDWAQLSHYSRLEASLLLSRLHFQEGLFAFIPGSRLRWQGRLRLAGSCSPLVAP